MSHRLRHKMVLVLFGFFLFLGGLLSWHLFVPTSGTSPLKIIQIKKGMPLKQISEVLRQEGVIRNKQFFIVMTALLGKKTKLKAGEYEFSRSMSPLEVLDTLVKGQVKQHMVTVPEGYTLSQIAQLLEDSGIAQREGFIEKATSPAFIRSLGLSASTTSTLEGFLFPETYHFIKEMNPEEVIRIMVLQFKKVFSQDLSHEASQLGLSEQDAIILASIIEKETSLPEEKPLISAVFHNRLKKRIPLQSDPTVIYGIKDFNGNLTRNDLVRPAAHNTYVRIGLPPTPICNPGKGSIDAALHPAPVPYLYFVSKNDGAHFFSSEIEDHNRAVLRFQIQGKKNILTKK
jgi:UPF0755 protein